MSAVKDRARRLQDKLDIPYTQALKMSEGIDVAARTQVCYREEDLPQFEIPEEDLMLLYLLGPTWHLWVQGAGNMTLSTTVQVTVPADNDDGWEWRDWHYHIVTKPSSGHWREPADWSIAHVPIIGLHRSDPKMNSRGLDSEVVVKKLVTTIDLATLAHQINSAIREDLPPMQRGLSWDKVGQWSTTNRLRSTRLPGVDAQGLQYLALVYGSVTDLDTFVDMDVFGPFDTIAEAEQMAATAASSIDNLIDELMVLDAKERSSVILPILPQLTSQAQLEQALSQMRGEWGNVSNQ